MVGGIGFCQHGDGFKPRIFGQFLRGQRSCGHDDRQFHAGGTHLLEQFGAGQLGHAVVGDQKIVAVGIECLPGGGAIFGGVHRVAGVNQHFGAELAEIRLIIHHENVLGQIQFALKWRTGLRRVFIWHVMKL